MINLDLSSIVKCIDLDMLRRATFYRVDDKIYTRIGNSDGEPLNVAIVNDPNAIDIHNFNEAVDVPKRVGTIVSSAEHIYTATSGKNLLLEKFIISASGRVKASLLIETGVGTDVYDTKSVIFTTTSNPTKSIDLKRNILVSSNTRVKIIKYNLDNDDQSIYSTIIGIEK